MPKFYCEYCGVYLTHSSPSGRKQHCRGRKHINNKIEYYNQLLIDQNQSGLLGNNSLKSTPLNPFARPLLPNIPFNIPGMMPSMNQGPQPNLNTSHINLPGILPSNITSLPLNQDSNKLQWGQNNQMNPQMNMNPLQMNPLQMNPQMNQMNPNMSQMMSGPMGPLQMGQMSLVGQLQGINPMQINQQNKGIGGFLGNNSNNNNNNQQGPNSNGSFIHPANVGQNPYQKQ